MGQHFSFDETVGSQSVWNYIPDDVLALILSYMPAKDIVQAAKVNKQFCICSYNNSIWKKKFYEDYDKKLKQNMPQRELEHENSFIELLNLDHPEHFVLTDWRRGYMMFLDVSNIYIQKVIHKTPHERFQCFSNCLALSSDGRPFLNNHGIPYYVYLPHLIEQVEPLKIERIFSKREVRSSDKHELNPNEKGKELYKSLANESSKKQKRLWLVADGAKHPSIVPKIQESNALSMSLFGKWFNHTNSNNFPFLVKFDSDPVLTEWLFTYGYDVSALLVFEIDPQLPEQVEKEWYLSFYDKTIALMIYLKRHLCQFFSVDGSGFCWIYNPTTIYGLAITFHSSFTNRLFYTIKNNGLFKSTMIPVIKNYLVFGNAFYFGELPVDPYYIQRDKDVEGCKRYASNADHINKGMGWHLEDRRIFKEAGKLFSTNPTYKSMPQYELHKTWTELRELLKKCKIEAKDWLDILNLIRTYGETFLKSPKVLSILKNSANSTALKLEMLQKLLQETAPLK